MTAVVKLFKPKAMTCNNHQFGNTSAPMYLSNKFVRTPVSSMILDSSSVAKPYVVFTFYRTYMIGTELKASGYPDTAQ